MTFQQQFFGNSKLIIPTAESEYEGFYSIGIFLIYSCMHKLAEITPRGA